MTVVSCLRNTIVSSAQKRSILWKTQKEIIKRKEIQTNGKLPVLRRKNFARDSEPQEPWKIRNIHT